MCVAACWSRDVVQLQLGMHTRQVHLTKLFANNSVESQTRLGGCVTTHWP